MQKREQLELALKNAPVATAQLQVQQSVAGAGSEVGLGFTLSINILGTMYQVSKQVLDRN